MSDQNLIPLLAPGEAEVVVHGEDPYPYMSDLVSEHTGRVARTFGRWKTLLATQNTAESSAFVQTQKRLTREIAQALDALQQMEMAVVASERNRSQCPHVDARELKRRRAQCDLVRRDIRKVKTMLHSESTALKIEGDKRKMLLAKRKRPALDANNGSFGRSKVVSNADFHRGHQMQQQSLLEKQDVSASSFVHHLPFYHLHIDLPSILVAFLAINP